MNTVRPILKGIHSPDVPDLVSANFEEDRPFCILVQAMFGPADEKGYESFDFILFNSLWAAQQDALDAKIFGPHREVDRFDYMELKSYLELAAKEIEEDSWEACAKRLAKVGRWEFEGYQEYDGG